MGQHRKNSAKGSSYPDPPAVVTQILEIQQNHVNMFFIFSAVDAIVKESLMLFFYTMQSIY